MPSKYQITVALSSDTILHIVSGIEPYTAFLKCAANLYKYSFEDQILIYAQKPDAVACAEIETWNKLGRWVNRGTKGITLLADQNIPYRLRYVFDLSDTNSLYGNKVYVWSMQQTDEPAVLDALENSFGDVEEQRFDAALLEIADHVVQDNDADYFQQLLSVKNGSLLDADSDDSLRDEFRKVLRSSIAFTVLSRCGYDPANYLLLSDFQSVCHFNTRETAAVLGNAAGDISEMVLREIENTVKTLRLESMRENRTFAKPIPEEHNNHINNQAEGGTEHGIDIQTNGRLPDPEPDRTGEPENREIRDASSQLSAGEQAGDSNRDVAGGQVERTPGTDRPAGERNDGDADQANGESAGRNGNVESNRPDEMGTDSKQHPAFGGGNRSEGIDLLLNELLPTEIEQENRIVEAEAQKASAFAISQEDIDAVLIRGSGISQGKFRIYEQYQKKESASANATMLKEEYGWGGSYPAVSKTDIDEAHDGSGIKISHGNIANPDSSVLLSWAKVEKRIAELIAADRYFSEKEKQAYPAYLREKADREERNRISQEFMSLVRDYNDYQTQLGENDKKLNQYYLSSCAQALSMGEKQMYARTADGDYILPMIREALSGIISEGTHLTERAETVFEMLNSEQILRLEPTYDEMNPSPTQRKEYRYEVGDIVNVGIQEYDILAMDVTEIHLYDPEFPLLNKVFSPSEFEEKLRENPLNDHLLQVVDQATPALSADTESSADTQPGVPIGRIDFLGSNGSVSKAPTGQGGLETIAKTL